MQAKKHYFISSHPAYPNLYLTACGRAMSAERGSVQPHVVDQSGHACIKCLYRLWRDFPYLKAQQMKE